MTEPTLLPCPFCGGEASKRLFYGSRYGVYCDECSARVGGLYVTETEAIEAWNTRAERTCHATYDHRGLWTCGACGHNRLTDSVDTMNYCPNCGVRIEGVEQ